MERYYIYIPQKVNDKCKAHARRRCAWALHVPNLMRVLLSA